MAIAMRRLIGCLGIGLIAAAFILGFLAYLVVSVEPGAGITHDGLGRPLTNSPWFMELIFYTGANWAGWKWFVVDMIVFWGLFGTGAALGIFGFKME